MKIVKPSNASHTLTVVPRFNYETSLTLNLYNETKQSDEDVSITTTLENGLLSVGFQYTFTEGDKYQVKIVDENEEVIYRGKLFATEQETQNYQLTEGLYYYE